MEARSRTPSTLVVQPGCVAEADRTADVCCYAIQYAQSKADLNWHSLAMCTMDGSNEGLVLAETICTIPFRSATNSEYPYQKWVKVEVEGDGDGEWTDME